MEALMDRKAIDEITAQFQALVAVVPLHAIRSEAEYHKAVSVLNRLLDAGGADEASPLADLIDTLGSFIADYEDVKNPAPAVSPAASLRFLMEQHGLSQSDLPEIGSQGVLSEILRGKRALNLRQVKLLAQRFHVPVALFM
jgi:HTH-type transcriptional regulator/antitoxin HigA